MTDLVAISLTSGILVNILVTITAAIKVGYRLGALTKGINGHITNREIHQPLSDIQRHFCTDEKCQERMRALKMFLEKHE